MKPKSLEKVWYLQFMLICKFLWPLLVYEISTSIVECIERKISKYTRKLLGLTPRLTDVALYCKMSNLCLPPRSVVKEFKAGKARLAKMLLESADMVVSEVQPTLKTARKW